MRASTNGCSGMRRAAIRRVLWSLWTAIHRVWNPRCASEAGSCPCPNGTWPWSWKPRNGRWLGWSRIASLRPRWPTAWRPPGALLRAVLRLRITWASLRMVRRLWPESGADQAAPAAGLKPALTPPASSRTVARATGRKAHRAPAVPRVYPPRTAPRGAERRCGQLLGSSTAGGRSPLRSCRP